MLEFFSLAQDKSGNLERVSSKLGLLELLFAFLSLNKSCQGDKKKIFKHIQAGLEEHLKYSDPNVRREKNFRFATSRWLRLKDLVQFILDEDGKADLRIKIAEILVQSASIDNKWEKIKLTLSSDLSEKSFASLAQTYAFETGEMHPILEWVALCFLEQDPEPPPPNLRLELVRGAFPKSYWVARKGSYHKSSPFWLPTNPLCHAVNLGQELTCKLLQVEKRLQEINNNSPLGRPSSVSLEFPNAKEEGGQLSLIPETPAETLLKLQGLIEKKLGSNGVRHLFGILRQVARAETTSFFFDFFSHAELLGYHKYQVNKYEAEEKNLEDVLSILNKVEVKRRYITEEPILERATPLFNSMTKHYRGISKKVAGQDLSLDAFVLGDGTNLRIGSHLNLVPERAFTEDSKKHKFLLPLTAYLAGSWVLEFSTNRGRLEKSAKELLAGCALKITPQAKRTIFTKLQSELDYLKEKAYIGSITGAGVDALGTDDLAAGVSKLGATDPYLQKFEITPPPAFLQNMQETYATAGILL
ncbi:MAG: hypothetical protein QNL04_15170 [SAR324 cluster bacterium]|nr:hypothetical protein [SAR324 cluster bacterium]